MAKVKLGNLDPRAFPRTRGAFVVADTPFGPVAKKWPAKSTKPDTWAKRWNREQFAYAAFMASTPEPRAAETARFLSQGTDYVPRDILMKAIYGNLYTIYGPDNQVWTAADHNAPPLPEGGFNLAQLYITTLRRLTTQGPSSTNPLFIEWEQADRDDLGLWDPGAPTRILIPQGVTLVRASMTLRMQYTGTNKRIYHTLRDNTGSDRTELLNGFQFDSVGSATTQAAGFIGQWVPPPIVDYVEAINSMFGTTSRSIIVNSSITIEALV